MGTGRAIALEAGLAALEDAGCTYTDVDAFFAAVAGPSSPQAPAVAKEFGLTGIPAQLVMNASATGLSAVHSAMMAIESRRADVVLVVGYDVAEYEVPNPVAAAGFHPPLTLFAQMAQLRMKEHGTKPEHFAMVAAKNWNYAREIPYAFNRADHEITADEVLASKAIAPPLTKMMCTAWTTGAAAIVLTSEEGAKKIGRTGVAAKIRASEFQTEVYTEGHIFEQAIVGPAELSTSTANAAMSSAGVTKDNIDVVGVHDAFANEEFLYMELLAFSKPGETEELIENGGYGPGSKAKFGVPEFSTDGGLIARGHPGGPTGVFQHIEMLRRFRTNQNDTFGLCHLLGVGSVCIVQIVERVEL
ncbi:MAG: 3-ketoacyl-CoA thiolase [Verrucomicrobia subdivision 3 bacterium]|nr:3-ketoacyl-CoA thiolase [Limisphaerales bacterium]